MSPKQVTIPQSVLEARQFYCLACAVPCPERDSLNLADSYTACPRRIWHAVDAPMRGLGDLVAKFAEPVGKIIGLDKATCGCAKRQDALNRLLPFKG